MKKFTILACFLIIVSNSLFSNGVVFNKETLGYPVKLKESKVDVKIENQVSNTVATQVFKNESGKELQVKYAFPLPEGSSATKLRYKINGSWYTAKFTAVPQDTTTGGSSGNDDETLKKYLGPNPLYYNIEDTIGIDSTIVVELSYVELLKYKFGNVTYIYPNNYSFIQTTPIDKQEINLSLNSSRTIDKIEILNNDKATISNSGNHADVNNLVFEEPASANYEIRYSLSLNELGLSSLSTYIPDSVQVDDYGRGFFAFVVEPDPSENVQVIDKVFTLIIDRSGSMSGDKIVQARDAAKFIVENLNLGDKFNIISFSDEVSSFRPSHVEYSIENKNAALDYISTLDANGSTNISGAFDMAVPQFSIANNNTANIIIFFTDGEQTSGILDTDALISHIDSLIILSEKQISLFSFGIGDYTNERLLSTIANNNNGMSEFLADNQLEAMITDFYMMIKNPVLLNTSVKFSPAVIMEMHPGQLPNLYKGQQMILVGRYNEPANLNINIAGKAFSKPVEYNYNYLLSDTFNSTYQFLTKLWAKGKMDDLMGQYYSNQNYADIADSIKKVITKISLDYGVISPFTSFNGVDKNPIGWGGTTEIAVIKDDQDQNMLSNEYITIASVNPNPCSDLLNITISSKTNAKGNLTIKLVDTKGQQVFSSMKHIDSNSIYNFTIDVQKLNLTKGVYILLVQFNNKILTNKIVVN